MRLAVLLFGISKAEFFHKHHHRKVRINYENTYENHKKVWNYFLKKGYQIDFYFSTNPLNENDTHNIIRSYRPVKYSFVDDEPNYDYSKNKKINAVVDLCLENEINYDLVLITRFDLIFNKDFEDSNIQLDKFNLVSILERPQYICDNFYLFPYSLLKDFSMVLKKNMYKSHHFIKEELDQINGDHSIHYILNEHCPIGGLSFYTIFRDWV